MTERLYYADAYLREFDASVVRVEKRDGKTRVVLDRTAFYPTSGGQPFDLGVFQGGVQIVDVIDEDDGGVVHIVVEGDGDIVVGQQVRGVIDWTRRIEGLGVDLGERGAADQLAGRRRKFRQRGQKEG